MKVTSLWSAHRSSKIENFTEDFLQNSCLRKALARDSLVILLLLQYVCMYVWSSHIEMDQPGKVILLSAEQ